MLPDLDAMNDKELQDYHQQVTELLEARKQKQTIVEIVKAIEKDTQYAVVATLQALQIAKINDYSSIADARRLTNTFDSITLLTNELNNKIKEKFKSLPIEQSDFVDAVVAEVLKTDCHTEDDLPLVAEITLISSGSQYDSLE